MLLQAYDFMELSRRTCDCRIQMGGSDQWGNIVNGIDLTRRIVDKHVFGVTTPADHHGVRAARWARPPTGAVWLNPEMRSPFDYWQFWRNTEDADVAKFMRLFTDLPEFRISEHAKAEGDHHQRRQETPRRCCDRHAAWRGRSEEGRRRR